MASDEDDFPILTNQGKSLGDMSIEELNEYISSLKSEINKVENVINTKKSAKSAADDIFKS